MDTQIGYESRRDRDLRDDTLKLVRFKILFVKREYEVAFQEEEDLVYDNIDGTSFAAWKVAQFIQAMHRDGIKQPRRWEEKNYPTKYDPKDKDWKKYFHAERLLRALPEEDKKYLRVYYEVLDRYAREKFRHDEQHIDVLREIRNEISEMKNSKRSSESGGDVSAATGDSSSGAPRSASSGSGDAPAGSPPEQGGSGWQVRGI